MKYLLSFTLILLSFLSVQSQKLMAVKVKKKWGAVDAKQNMVIPPQFDFIGTFDINGRAVAQNNTLYGVIDSRGKTFIDFKYKYLQALPNTNTFSFRENAFLGVINSDDSVIINNEYDAIEEISSSEYSLTAFVLKKDGKYLLANSQGKILCEPLYKGFEVVHDLFVQSRANNKLGLIHWQKGELAKPQFQSINILNENYFVFSQKGNNGLYSLKTQKVVIEPSKYDDYKLFTQDSLSLEYFYVYKDGQVGIVNNVGKLILQLGTYEQIKYNISGDVFLVRKGLKFGVSSNRTGKVLQPKYDLVSDFKQNIAQVIIGNKRGIINSSGEEIVKPIYQKVEVKGNSARLYLDDGSVEVLILDDLGKILSRSKLEGKIRHIKIKRQSEFDFSWTQEQQDSLRRLRFLRNPNHIWLQNDRNLWGLRKFDNQRVVVIANIYRNISTDTLSNITVAQRIGRNYLIEDSLGLSLLEDGVRWDVNEAVQDFRGSQVARWKYEEEDSIYNCYIYRNPEIKGENPFKFYQDSDGNNLEIIRVEPFYKGYSKFMAQNNSERGANKPKFWGVMRNTGDVIVPAIYKDVQLIEDDSSVYFVVTYETKYRSKYGYVGKDGKVQINLQYEQARPFSEGKAGVRKRVNLGTSYRSAWAFINPQDTAITKFMYSRVGNFNRGFVGVKGDSTYRRRGKNARITIKINCIDSLGNKVFYKSLNKMDDFDENGLAIVRRSKRYGIVDTTGKWIVKPKYNRIYPYNKYGLAKIRQGRLYFFVDRQGKKTHKSMLKTAGDFNEEGISKVRLRNKTYNFVNHEGKLISKKNFQAVKYFHQDLAPVKRKDFWGFIDKRGFFRIQPKYNSVSCFYKNYAQVSYTKEEIKEKKEKNGKITKEKIKITERYFIDPSENRRDSLSSSLAWFRVDRYMYLGEFEKGIARMQLYNRIGFINNQGQIVIPAYYDEATDFYQGYAFVKKRKEYFFINTQSDTLKNISVKNVPLNIKNKLDTRPEEERYEIFELNGRQGLQTPNGTVIIPPKYTNLGKYSEGLAVVGLNLFQGLRGNNGQTLLPAIYEDINLTDTKTFRVEANDKVGYWHTTREWIWEMK